MERHGFVTFWLGFIMVFSIIGMLFYTLGSDYVNSFYHSHIASIILGVGAIIVFISVILLLKWRIFGFWLMIIGGIIQTIFMISWGYGFLSTIIQSAIPFAILWGILQLKKNGVSAWDYLTNNNVGKQYSTGVLNKKCRQCNTIYSGSICPKCGSSLYEEVNNVTAFGQTSGISPINRNYGDTWVCKKCSERNPLTSSSCKSCGEYK